MITPEEARVVASRIRLELNRLDELFVTVSSHEEAFGRYPELRHALTETLALDLHSFYTGLERVFEMVGRTVEGVVPVGERWHHELLEQMTVEVAGVRPAVLSREVAGRVEEMLKFRHVVRSVYSFDLDTGRVLAVYGLLLDAWSDVQREVLAFAGFLDRLASD
jgi:hypothetical protein